MDKYLIYTGGHYSKYLYTFSELASGVGPKTKQIPLFFVFVCLCVCVCKTITHVCYIYYCQIKTFFFFYLMIVTGV